MNGYNRAYRDPKSPLTPITPRCKTSAFSFKINSDCDMSRCLNRKSSCSDYACGDTNSCGDYSCGDYSCRDYSCGDYSCGDYSRSLGSSDSSCSNTYSSCSSRKNSYKTFSGAGYACSLGSSASENSCKTYSCSPCSGYSKESVSKEKCCNSYSCSNESKSCNDYSCSYSNSCNDSSSCNSDSSYLPNFNLFKNNGLKFRSFTDLHRNPYQCRDCCKNSTEQENICTFSTLFNPSANCMKSNSSCSLNNNSSCFSSDNSSSCSKSNSCCGEQASSFLLGSIKSSSCSKLGSLSTFFGYFGSGNTLQVPSINTFKKPSTKSDNLNNMRDNKSEVLKSIKKERTDSKPIDPQVNHLLEKAGLSKYKSLFEREEIDCLALSLMRTADLKKLNIPDSDIVRFLQIIKEIVQFFQGMTDV